MKAQPIFLAIAMIFCLFVQPFEISAQIPNTNLGIIKNELLMESYAPDPAAGAVVLQDYGEANIEESGGNLSLVYKIYRRVKIFDESGFDLAEVVLPFEGSGHQKLSNIQARTYYLEGESVESIKVAKKEIIREKVSKDWDVMKFNLPQVKEGTVFEYSYSLTDEHIGHIRPWYFQHDYPVILSEYSTKIPEWYTFLPLFKGGLPLSDKKEANYQETISMAVSQLVSADLFNPNNTTVKKERFPYIGTRTTYIMEAVPAFVAEPYMTTEDDHLVSLQFQLQMVKFPNSEPRMIMSDWENLAKRYLGFNTFGNRLKDGKIKKTVKSLPLADKSVDEKVYYIYNFVRGSMNWNGQYSDLAERALKDAFEQKEGSSGEINLTLLAMLRAAGLDAYPIICSTRGHGKVQQIYPLASQFNHVIILAALGEGGVLLDASHDFTAFGMLPEAVLNGQGFLIDPEIAQWVNLQPQHKQESIIMANMSLDESGTLNGQVSHTCKGYTAKDSRLGLTKVKQDEMEFAQTYLMQEWTDIDIERVEVKDYENLNAPMKITCKFEGSDYVNVSGEYIYIQPMLSIGQEENPFKLKERSYPVDIPAPIKEKYILSLLIPPGYEVAEVPAPAKVVLPEGGGAFMYQTQVLGDQIQLLSDLSISQTVFQPEEYEFIRAYFDHVVAKHAEQIVLKKTN